MFPLHDNVPSRTFPFVGYAIIALCGVAFATQLREGEGVVAQYGMVPARVTGENVPVELVQPVPVRLPDGRLAVVERKRVLAPSAVPPWMTLLTCMFLHGGWMHIIGNMWFLYIFGDNVEDRFGHLGFLLLYLFCGVAASAAHLASSPESIVPTIGASGAIAGVMGAYMVLYPRAQVLAVVPIVFFLYTLVVPAPVFLGVWFAIQFFQGVGSISGVDAGVAWWAHIGGFLAGLAVAAVLRQGPLRPAVERTETYRAGPYHFRRREF